ncbi:DUF1289 domain-containing protein [Erythrobacter pelagi]|uniref:DUF1289 domain-containing protein n=1 Tax=Qipengyuania pelagi TaxID=994320 RepID=A0A844Y3Z2_9SPHN|nr:DUF1289 domain-containing protein [Qipengyuania pelagi]MXO52546.1 DUF1289 domain-containing protein [Qipengyuania pelagi]
MLWTLDLSRSWRDQPPVPAIASPCINLCRLDRDNRHCTGCGRSLDEIAAWQAASDADKRAIIREAAERLRVAGSVRPEPMP